MDVKGKLYYGDNLEVLRNHIPSESVDLIYLDPPFNSNANYNVLYSSPESGEQSHSQIQAFEDTWHWGPEAQLAFDDIMRLPNTNLASLIDALRRFLGENDMMAYLVMMAIRLNEMRRALKPTGSLYLHCDPTASHYLKLILDAVFGHGNFKNEISWRRSSAHNDAKQGRQQYGNIRDTIFYYTKNGNWRWNQQYTPYDKSYVEKNYRHRDEQTGRIYRLDNLTAAKPGGDVSYEFMGTHPYKGRFWAYSRENMEKFFNEGRLYFPPNGGTPAYKRYLDEMPGVPLQNNWDDIQPASGNEDLGFPTQKPVALLERILQASSNEGDVVLDPFCGCGTAIHAAQKLGRNWIGIDITNLAISLIEKRMKDAFPGIVIETEGIPKDIEGAQYLASRDKYQFQWWAVSLVGAQPYQEKKKGSDGGIDGLIFFRDAEDGGYKKIVVSVKGGEHVGAGMIRDLVGTMDREKAPIGIFITLNEPTRDMLKDAAARPMYESPLTKKRYPSVQILTIKGLMDGSERAEYPDLNLGQSNFKKAATERTEKEAKLF